MKQQLALIDAPVTGWKRLDTKTIEVGRKGIAQAREALREANERMAGASAERAIGFPGRRLAAEEGVVFPDFFVHVPGVGSRKAFEKVLYDLRPGVTEILAHPAVDTGELRSSHPDWSNRVDDHQLLVNDKDVRSMNATTGSSAPDVSCAQSCDVAVNVTSPSPRSDSTT